ncbi:uncharacterized protein I206_100493 [Kwoniella pini CBS 10737]|uniref:Uncharacterized protein n=1 Tax=Kwoniella pini CBS 10737 TaxID=1296096 RepID=A0AAJ8L066_9TREE
MGCTSSKHCCDPECELPGHAIPYSNQRSHRRNFRLYTHSHIGKRRHYSFSVKPHKSSNFITNSKTPMIQRDSVASMRDIIDSMGGWHEGERR